MAQLKGKKIPASTLVEVIIAMVIIMAVFVTGVAIYSNVVKSGYSYSKVQATKEMRKMLEESRMAGDWEDQEIEVDSIRYKKTVLPYQGYPDLVLLEIKALQHDKVLATLKQVVKKEP